MKRRVRTEPGRMPKTIAEARRWLAAYRQMRQGYDCIHGHLECSRVDLGPCSNEIAARFELEEYAPEESEES